MKWLLRSSAVTLVLSSAACGTLSPALPKAYPVDFTAGAAYSGASDSEWYASLKQPDSINNASCCGVADAYYADETEVDPLDGGIIAVITDTRPDLRQVGANTFVNRPHVPPGTKIKVPASKLRKVPSFNPTDHTVIFLSNTLGVYCYEPAPLM